MKTTIQISPEEDKEIAILRDALGLPTKKEVLREGIRLLKQVLDQQKRKKRLQAASRLIRDASIEVNRQWSPLSTLLKVK